MNPPLLDQTKGKKLALSLSLMRYFYTAGVFLKTSKEPHFIKNAMLRVLKKEE